jgi:hypothetical protein
VRLVLATALGRRWWWLWVISRIGFREPRGRCWAAGGRCWEGGGTFRLAIRVVSPRLQVSTAFLIGLSDRPFGGSGGGGVSILMEGPRRLRDFLRGARRVTGGSPPLTPSHAVTAPRRRCILERPFVVGGGGGVKAVAAWLEGFLLTCLFWVEHLDGTRRGKRGKRRRREKVCTNGEYFSGSWGWSSSGEGKVKGSSSWIEILYTVPVSLQSGLGGICTLTTTSPVGKVS